MIFVYTIEYRKKISAKWLLKLDISRDFYENIFYNNAKKLFNIRDN